MRAATVHFCLLTWALWQAAERGMVGAEQLARLMGEMTSAGVEPDRTFFGSCMSLLAGASLHGKATGQDAK